MSDPVAAIAAVSAVSAQSPTSTSGVSPGRDMAMLPTPGAHDVASFHAMVQGPSASSAGAEIGGKLVDAGVGLSQRYADRLSGARELASISPEEYGMDHSDYMRAMLYVQVSLSEVTVELQSTAQIANSVKDSFNGLYRMQG